VETALVSPLALAYICWLVGTGSSSFGAHGAGHALLLMTTGIVTAIPLICFGGAAIRVPMVTLGLLQYLAPILQFALGVLWFHEDMPPGRWAGFVLVWVALVMFTFELTRHHRQLRLAVAASAA
jgi:chloramphenicol-sensitive protein RarD